MTLLAMFLCTKTLPGSSPMISLAGTLASAQPSQRIFGAWGMFFMLPKKAGLAAAVRAAHALLASKRGERSLVSQTPYANGVTVSSDIVKVRNLLKSKPFLLSHSSGFACILIAENEPFKLVGINAMHDTSIMIIVRKREDRANAILNYASNRDGS